MKAKLIAYKINRVNFNNEFNGSETISLLYQVSINWKKENDNDVLGISLKISDDNRATDFAIDVDAEGMFETQGAADEAKEQCLRDLLYLLRSFITTFTSAIGLPPIFLPVWDIAEDLKKADLEKQGQGTEE